MELAVQEAVVQTRLSQYVVCRTHTPNGSDTGQHDVRTFGHTRELKRDVATERHANW